MPLRAITPLFHADDISSSAASLLRYAAAVLMLFLRFTLD